MLPICINFLYVFHTRFNTTEVSWQRYLEHFLIERDTPRLFNYDTVFHRGFAAQRAFWRKLPVSPARQAKRGARAGNLKKASAKQLTSVWAKPSTSSLKMTKCVLFAVLVFALASLASSFPEPYPYKSTTTTTPAPYKQYQKREDKPEPYPYKPATTTTTTPAPYKRYKRNACQCPSSKPTIMDHAIFQAPSSDMLLWQSQGVPCHHHFLFVLTPWEGRGSQ